jgi:hypothetical protein
VANPFKPLSSRHLRVGGAHDLIKKNLRFLEGRVNHETLAGVGGRNRSREGRKAYSLEEEDNRPPIKCEP